jgi:glutamyl-tRNA synthetase
VFAADFFEFARKAQEGCRLRFAPTPSGFLHIGNALNFTLNWLVARLHNGSILLRIDDLDAERKRPEYMSDIFESLHWLGLDWDEGPGLVTGADPVLDFEANWSQNLRLSLYFEALDQLRAQNLLFPCQKSRRELAAFLGKYPPEFRDQNLSLDDTDVAWRIRCPQDSGLSDFVLRRRDGVPAYQIASLVDDLHFGITDVVRGADLEGSTQAQRFLAECLGARQFLNIHFLHHPLLLDGQGEKLSKSAGASSLKAMRERKLGPSQVFNTAGNFLGLGATASADELLAAVKRRCFA